MVMIHMGALQSSRDNTLPLGLAHGSSQLDQEGMSGLGGPRMGQDPSIHGPGGLEDLRTGGLEDWRTGGLEDWRTGGLEDWRTGGLGD